MHSFFFAIVEIKLKRTKLQQRDRQLPLSKIANLANLGINRPKDRNFLSKTKFNLVPCAMGLREEEEKVLFNSASEKEVPQQLAAAFA